MASLSLPRLVRICLTALDQLFNPDLAWGKCVILLDTLGNATEIGNFATLPF